MQRKPEPDPDNPGFERDGEYTGVKMLRLGTKPVYKILNEGPHYGKKLYYDAADNIYYLADRVTNLSEEAEAALAPDAQGQLYFMGEQPFDIATVSAERRPKSEYKAGAEGIGVGYPTERTRLRTHGLVSCVGWLLFNEQGAYLTHIVVSHPAKVLPDGIQPQVRALYDTFAQNVGEPTDLWIVIDKAREDYPEDLRTSWLPLLVPAGADHLEIEYLRRPGEIEHQVPGVANPGQTVIWTGPPVIVRYRD